jgi:hypothetical protein
VKLEVFSVLGQRVSVLVDGALPAGSHSARFVPHGLEAGVYYARLSAGGFHRVQKVLFLK